MDIRICEVGPRDGLQSLPLPMPLEHRKRWIEAEAAAGVREIEVGSFVSPRVLPQMAQTAALVAHARAIPGLGVAALVPNLRGARAAIEAGADAISVPISASESHSRANVNRSCDEMIEEVRAIRAAIDELPQGQRPRFDANVATAFGCSIEGRVPLATVVRLAERMMAAGADGIGLADTVGAADPHAIRERIRAVRAAVGHAALDTIHLHNTRGLGLANALAAIEEGIGTLDASLGGLGGCPAAPGASGNIVTEDLAFMCGSMGLATGIDLEALIAVRAVLAEGLRAAGLPDEPLHGFVGEAGLPLGWMDEWRGARERQGDAARAFPGAARAS